MKFNMFNEVNPPRLKVFNRVVMAFNLLEDFGQARMEDYLEQFSLEDRLDIKVMSNYILKVGPDQARREVTKGLVFSDD